MVDDAGGENECQELQLPSLSASVCPFPFSLCMSPSFLHSLYPTLPPLPPPNRTQLISCMMIITPHRQDVVMQYHSSTCIRNVEPSPFSKGGRGRGRVNVANSTAPLLPVRYLSSETQKQSLLSHRRRHVSGPSFFFLFFLASFPFLL